MSACSEKCWTPVACPDHGDAMNPFGRSSEGWDCCERRMESAVNPRHLWDEHDSSRWYTDPLGWAEHESGCQKCSPEEAPHE